VRVVVLVVTVDDYIIGSPGEDLVIANDIVNLDMASWDKTLVEKVQLIEQLDDSERKSIFSIIDGLSSKMKMKDSLAKALAQ
jgi:hypothetical protein